MNFDFDNCFWRRYLYSILEMKDIFNLMISSKIFYIDKNKFYIVIFSKIQYEIIKIFTYSSYIDNSTYKNPIKTTLLDIEKIIKITNICLNNLYIRKFMTKKYIKTRYHRYFRKYFIENTDISDNHKKMDLFISELISDKSIY